MRHVGGMSAGNSNTYFDSLQLGVKVPIRKGVRDSFMLVWKRLSIFRWGFFGLFVCLWIFVVVVKDFVCLFLMEFWLQVKLFCLIKVRSRQHTQNVKIQYKLWSLTLRFPLKALTCITLLVCVLCGTEYIEQRKYWIFLWCISSCSWKPNFSLSCCFSGVRSQNKPSVSIFMYTAIPWLCRNSVIYCCLWSRKLLGCLRCSS